MIHAVLHQPQSFSTRAGLLPLVRALRAKPAWYEVTWENWQKRSWTAGQLLRKWGIRHYGSVWNGLVPYRDEWYLARQIQARGEDIVHFMWGEFAAPRHPDWFNRRGAMLVGTFHCSARRQPQVLGGYRCLHAFDRISVMSKSQIPFFLDRGYPADRMDVVLHGVDTDFFVPTADKSHSSAGALRLLLVGSTERDHDFAATVMKALADEPVTLDVLTSPINQLPYAGLGNVRLLGNLFDEELRSAYREHDLLFMPMLDCTANNAVLESMACGTPVMINRVGGVPEYVPPDCSLIMANKQLELWVGSLREVARNRSDVITWRPMVRDWAERFAWPVVADSFREFYGRANRSPLR